MSDKNHKIKVAAKIGYASRGIVYLIIGGLAVMAAFGEGGDKVDSKGALQRTLQAPGGWILVALIAIGLLGYCVWRFYQSVLDVDDHGKDIKGIMVRGGLLVSGITHLLLAFWAGYTVFGMITGEGSGGSGDSSGKQAISSWLMSQPFGRWLIIIVGLSVIGAGVAHVIKGAKDKFEKWFDWDAQKRKMLSPVCSFGLYARSVIFFIIGIFFIYAGWTLDSDEAGGLPEAMTWLQGQPFGKWLFLIVSAGLIAFGIYSLTEAIYRRIAVSN